MKKISLLILVAGFMFIGINQAQAQKEEAKVLLVPQNDTETVFAYPISVVNVINNKCLGCHSPSGKSDDAKEDLMWEKLQGMDPADMVAVLDEIIEVLEEGKMPPKKIVAKYPHLKMSDEETTILKSWAEMTSNNLMGE